MNLIRHFQLPNGRETTNLGFGCAGLMRTPSVAGREKLLRTAFDAGITHFDVARMYGDGLAENFVGSALKPVRDRVTIATKFGLPFVQESGSGGLKSLAKAVMHKTGLRDTIKKVLHKPEPVRDPNAAPTPNHYTVAKMEESLAESLGRLQTDHVDLFLIHEPAKHDVIADELAPALAAKKAAGQIGAFGVSAGRSEADFFLHKRPEICGEAIQHPFDIFRPGDEPVHHTYSGIFAIYGAALAPLVKYLAANRAVAKSWSDKLGLDLTSRENIGIVILAVALNIHPQGMVLFTTSNADRLPRAMQKLRDNIFTEASLREFRRAMSQGIHAS